MPRTRSSCARRWTRIGAPLPRFRVVERVEEVADFGFPVRPQDVARWLRRQGRVVRRYAGRVRAGVRGSRADRRTPARRGARRPFRRELSALVARSPSGQAAAYPVVESTQRDGICREVIAPAPDLDPELAARAEALALRIARELDVTGILAVELFETAGRVARQRARDAPPQHGPLDPGRRRHVAVREPPARRARPAARLAGRPRAVDGDGQHPRRPDAVACTTATRMRWPATRGCASTSTARSRGRVARSGT